MRWNPDIYVDPDGSEKKLVNQTQEKLKALIRNFFEQHKDQLKENGIEYLEGISPQNAAKLSAIISMQYLSYSHAQAISPNEETQYIK